MAQVVGVWLDHERWVCRQHMRSVSLPASAPRCWYAHCSERPPLATRPDATHVVCRPTPKVPEDSLRSPRAATALTTVSDIGPIMITSAWDSQDPAAEAKTLLRAGRGEACALPGCSETARPGSKYCGRRCSNHNARRRYRARKRDAGAATAGSEQSVVASATS